MQETPAQFLGREDPGEGIATQSRCLDLPTLHGVRITCKWELVLSWLWETPENGANGKPTPPGSLCLRICFDKEPKGCSPWSLSQTLTQQARAQMVAQVKQKSEKRQTAVLSVICGVYEMAYNELIINQKQTHKHRKQITKEESGKGDKSGGWDQHIHTAIYKTGYQ